MAWKEKDLKEAFRTFDSDDKGFMHAAELKYVLMRMDDPTVTDEDIKEMLADTGLNINRKITFKGKYSLCLQCKETRQLNFDTCCSILKTFVNIFRIKSLLSINKISFC